MLSGCAISQVKNRSIKPCFANWNTLLLVTSHSSFMVPVFFAPEPWHNALSLGPRLCVPHSAQWHTWGWSTGHLSSRAGKVPLKESKQHAVWQQRCALRSTFVAGLMCSHFLLTWIQAVSNDLTYLQHWDSGSFWNLNYFFQQWWW